METVLYILLGSYLTVVVILMDMSWQEREVISHEGIGFKLFLVLVIALPIVNLLVLLGFIKQLKGY